MDRQNKKCTCLREVGSYKHETQRNSNRPTCNGAFIGTRTKWIQSSAFVCEFIYDLVPGT